MSSPVLTTDEVWSVDGTPLNTYAYNIATLGGSRLGVPPLRGDDGQFAYRPGAIFRPKVADSRVISLMMWVLGIDATAPDDLVSDPRLQWNDNWEKLRRLFWTPTRQLQLQRTWKLTRDSTPTLVTATALAQLAGPMDPEMQGRFRGEFGVDLKLADPFFYGTEISADIPLGSSVEVVNPGDDSASFYSVEVDFVGPLTNPTLRNTTPTPDVAVSVAGSVSGTLTLDVSKFTLSPSSFPLGSVSHSGARSWFGLLPGANTLSLTASSGSGHATVRFKPPYL